MSWNKIQFEKSYNRAGEKHSMAVEENGTSYWDLYDYWDDMYYDDGQHPTMGEHLTGRLLVLLSKLNVRGMKTKLDEWYW